MKGYRQLLEEAKHLEEALDHAQYEGISVSGSEQAIRFATLKWVLGIPDDEILPDVNEPFISQKAEIIDAYVQMQTTNQSIPDDVLDFMKDAAIEKLDKVY